MDLEGKDYYQVPKIAATGEWTKYCMIFFQFVGYVYGKCVYIIGLKTPGNYSDQLWFNKISILLREGPKPSKCMISLFLDLLLMDYLAYL